MKNLTVNQFEAAVLIIGFNRPKLLRDLLNNLDIGSRGVYISIDAPRHNNEAKLVHECKVVATEFQSKAHKNQVVLNFRETNLGLSEAVITAINWAFEKEEKLIILEDDVFPTKDFFAYMDYHLYQHQKNSEIWQVGGHNPNPKTTLLASDYLSIFPMIWGWGTWRDRWVLYDREPRTHEGLLLSYVKRYADSKILNSEFSEYFESRIKLLISGFDTWDFQWAFSMWRHKSFSIQPANNLTLNLGQNTSGTHATSSEVFLTKRRQTRRRIQLSSNVLKRDKHQDAVTWGFVFGRTKELSLVLRTILKGHFIYDRFARSLLHHSKIPRIS